VPALNHRVSLVTGAGSGIGAAIARCFAAAGGIIVATDVNEAAATRVAQEINDLGGTAAAFGHDVGDENSWHTVVTAAVMQFRRIDVLVNNAGVAAVDSALVDLQLAEWRRVFAVNCDGPFLGMKHVIPVMPPGGSIINVSSIYGKVGGARRIAYCASKGAVTLMSKAAALECADQKKGIRVNSLHPGYVETPMFDRLNDVQKAGYAAMHPLGRVGRAAEIANAALFLASSESEFVTGSELIVDGGYTAR
jgi:NAD(P)-dependent dehydrogenase (short-subunit alcohol dehydrogenase family)